MSTDFSPRPDEDDPHAEGAPTRPDRRRPGRVQYRNPHLIALLRSGHRAPPSPDGTEPQGHEAPDESDDLDPARGLAMAVVFGVILWLGVMWLLFLTWRHGIF